MNEQRFDGAIGQEYDLFCRAIPHYDEFQDVVRTTLTDYFATKDQPEIKVLEIGYGTGFTTKKILSADPRIRVIGVDYNERMRAAARTALGDLSERVTFHVQGALSIMSDCLLASNVYDAIVSAFTIHNFEQDYREEFLKQSHLLLKDGGLFLNADKYVKDTGSEFCKDLEWELKRMEEVFGKLGRQDLVEAWTDHYFEDAHPDRIMKEEESLRLMHRLGFRSPQFIYKKRLEVVLRAIK